MKNKLIEKIQKEFPEFVNEVSGLDLGALNSRVAQLAQAGQENEDAKEADEALQKAREASLQLGAPYRDANKVIKLKTKYLLHLVKG